MLVWSPDGSKLAFVVDVDDFVWNESKDQGAFVNRRRYLAIVSLNDRAAGYQLTGSPGAFPQVRWLGNTQIEVHSRPGSGDVHRTFDLTATPPRPIP
jgi:hypothetical protein